MISPLRVLLFEKEDLDWAMGRPGGMMEMVRRKWRLAVRDGRSYLPVIRPFDLIQGTPSHVEE